MQKSYQLYFLLSIFHSSFFIVKGAVFVFYSKILQKYRNKFVFLQK